MGEILFILLTLYFLYRSYTNMQKQAKQEAEQRRRRNEEIGRRLQEQKPATPAAPPETQRRATTLEDLLGELLGDEPRPFPQPVQKTRPGKKQRQPGSGKASSPKRRTSAEPFLSADYSPELTPEAAPILDVPTSEAEHAPVTVQQPVTPPPRPSRRAAYRFNLRQAVIAKAILDRPEW